MLTTSQPFLLSGYVSLDWGLCSDLCFAVCVACPAFLTWTNMLHHIYFSRLLCLFRFQASVQFHNPLELPAFPGFTHSAGIWGPLGCTTSHSQSCLCWTGGRWVPGLCCWLQRVSFLGVFDTLSFEDSSKTWCFSGFCPSRSFFTLHSFLGQPQSLLSLPVTVKFTC